MKNSNVLSVLVLFFGVFLPLDGVQAQDSDVSVNSVANGANTTEPAAPPPYRYSTTGYVDNALINNRLRFRFDAAYGNNRPDRAEFFYAECLNKRCTGGEPVPHLDYQEFRLDGEYAFINDRLSLFTSLPYRSVDPAQNPKDSGIGDVVAGLKSGILSNAKQQLTFQLMAYMPTGKSQNRLGTNHYSLEPGILYFLKPADRWTLESELKLWIPIGGSHLNNKEDVNALRNGNRFAGNILRFGAGLGYDLPQTLIHRITPVVEVVGWTVLSGYERNVNVPTDINNIDTTDSARTTIVNLKMGARVAFDKHNSVYAGYGKALTKDVWYDHIVRAEYRYEF